MQKTLALFLFIFTSVLTTQAQRPASPKAGLLRGPYLQAASTNSIVIRSRTDVLTRGIVHCGTDRQLLDRNSQDTILVTEHKVKLEGLQPNTKYYYTIGSFKDTLQGGADNYFVTLPIPVATPEPGKETLYRIAAVGDCGNNSVNQRSVRDAL